MTERLNNDFQFIEVGRKDPKKKLLRQRKKEFVEIYDSFNRMVRELGTTETLQTDFISSVSHEFKTPIVSILGFARLLKRKDLPPEKRDEYLDIILSEATRLQKQAGRPKNLDWPSPEPLAPLPPNLPFAVPPHFPTP